MMEASASEHRHGGFNLPLSGREALRKNVAPGRLTAVHRLGSADAMRRVMFAGWVALAITACGGNEPKVVSAIAGLPEYTPSEASLYGDEFTAAVFGLPKEIAPSQDPKLRERTDRADAIIPVRISTVTADSLAGVRAYTLGVVADGAPVVGSAPAGQLEIRLGPGNPSLTQVQLADTSLVGKRFLLFVRRYADAGEAVNHYHGEADAPDVRKAIESAQALDSLKNAPQNQKER
jgi:hypothetical protein